MAEPETCPIDADLARLILLKASALGLIENRMVNSLGSTDYLYFSVLTSIVESAREDRLSPFLFPSFVA